MKEREKKRRNGEMKKREQREMVKEIGEKEMTDR